MEDENSKWVGFLNCLILLFSIAILTYGAWFAFEAVDCDKYLQKPTIAFAAALSAVSIAGVVAAAYRLNWLLGLHLLGMILVILALLCFSAFALAVATSHGGGPGHWLQMRVENGESWNRIKECLIEGNFCGIISVIQEVNRTCQAQAKFLSETLTPIECGCCKSPECCKNSNNPDCSKYRENDPKTLCFSCESCKAGMVKSLKTHWTELAILSLFFVVFLVTSFSFGCSAFSFNRRVTIVHSCQIRPSA